MLLLSNSLHYLELLHSTCKYFAVLRGTQVNSQRLNVIIFPPLVQFGFHSLWTKPPPARASVALVLSHRLQATWTSRWWTCPSCSALWPSWRAWSSTATASTTEWPRKSPWDSSSGTCKCEHTHTHRGFLHSEMGGRRGIVLAIEEMLWCVVLELRSWSFRANCWVFIKRPKLSIACVFICS